MARMLQCNVTQVLLEDAAIDKMGTDPIPCTGSGGRDRPNSWINGERLHSQLQCMLTQLTH